MVFSSFTRKLFPEMLGMRIIRTVLPLIVGVAARALCDIAQAVNQSFSPTFWFAAQPASVTNKPTTMMLEILIFDFHNRCALRRRHLTSRPKARFGNILSALRSTIRELGGGIADLLSQTTYHGLKDYLLHSIVYLWRKSQVYCSDKPPRKDGL